MADHRVILKLNQQQLELVDKTVAKGEASSRAELVRRALKEFAAKHTPEERSGKGSVRQ